jgi:ABC-type transporter Mla MlaB component
MPAIATEEKARFELRSASAGAATVVLSGRLDARSTAKLWRELDAALRENRAAALEVDASGVEHYAQELPLM